MNLWGIEFNGLTLLQSLGGLVLVWIAFQVYRYGAVLKSIADQFRTDSGSSLKDQLDAIQHLIDDLHREQVQREGYPSRADLGERMDSALHQLEQISDRLAVNQSEGRNLPQARYNELMIRFNTLSKKRKELLPVLDSMASGSEKFSLKEELERTEAEQNEVADQLERLARHMN